MSGPLCPLIAGNWKMHGRQADGLALAGELARRARRADAARQAHDLLVCPPYTLLSAVAQAIADSPVALGAQDCHTAASGAHTGDVAAPMLADLGCRYVIVGHSERRAKHGESDRLVNAKATAAHAAGLVAIVCLGETEAERDDGKALAVVGHQFEASLPASATADNTVIAYEPVWAIGTGRTATPAQAQEVHAFIRASVARKFAAVAPSLRILYGGSVKPDNIRELIAEPDVDGALVGGASLDVRTFSEIVLRSRPAAV